MKITSLQNVLSLMMTPLLLLTHLIHSSDDDPDKKQPKYNPNYSSNSSRKSTGTSTGTTKKQIHPQQELSPILKDTNSSKVINYELQVISRQKYLNNSNSERVKLNSSFVSTRTLKIRTFVVLFAFR